MRFLITSGGTKVNIDPVRHIQNMSTGRFGASLAKEALIAGAEVIYLVAEGARSPFSLILDRHDPDAIDHDLANVQSFFAFTEAYRHCYREYRYQDFYDYQATLQHLVTEQKPDIMLLAAAVSDYLPNYAHEKIRSGTALTLTLADAPKVIQQVKQWSPSTFLVGFKLLIDASDDALVQAAMKVFAASRADLVVANNLASIQRGKHEVVLVQPDGSYEKMTHDVASEVINHCIKRISK